MKIYRFLQNLFKHLITRFTTRLALLIFSLTPFITHFSLAGGVGDGGGTGRQLVMQAADEVATIIDKFKEDLFNGQLTGKKFLSMIDTNDIVSVPLDPEHYAIEYEQKKFRVQCQELDYESVEMIKSLITKAVFKKIHELQKFDFSPLMEMMGLLNIPQYLNPEQDAAKIAKGKGFNLKTNSCSLHIPVGQGAHGDLDMDINEFTNAKGNKMTTAYYVIREEANFYDYIDFVELGIEKVLKIKNDITENNEIYLAKKIKKLKLNKRTHTYEFVFEPPVKNKDEFLIGSKTTIECEKPLNKI